ncbi:MAG: hypothetical protein EBQ92_09415 [Proteobacteria bacterium]|nr:hypothetical protein [Pseudomonadota bacterium]
MKTFFKLAMTLSCLTLISCAKSSLPQMMANSGSQNTQSPLVGAMSATRQRGVTNIYSGPTGSPTSNNTYAPGAASGYPNPVPGQNLFGLTSQTTVKDPQECVNSFNRYPRYSGNFDTALAELATCLNQVMISQNPTLFQQYQTLQQNYGYGY